VPTAKRIKTANPDYDDAGFFGLIIPRADGEED